jgi:hypothetical protein
MPTQLGDSGGGVFGIWSDQSQLELVCAGHDAGPNGIPNTGCRITTAKFRRMVDDWLTQ